MTPLEWIATISVVVLFLGLTIGPALLGERRQAGTVVFICPRCPDDSVETFRSRGALADHLNHAHPDRM